MRKIVVKFSSGKWSQFSSGGSIKAAKHKLISFRSWPWWMITKANKGIAKRKHTYLFYGNVNCTSKAKASESVRFSSPKWGVAPTTFYHFASTHVHFEITSITIFLFNVKVTLIREGMFINKTTLYWITYVNETKPSLTEEQTVKRFLRRLKLLYSTQNY